jgi:pimeloyl-ACP methyl ester carboxylesterase
MIEPRSFIIHDHTVSVPLDHARPDGQTIEVFAREIGASEKAGDELPWLLFLQGGPGGASPRPSRPDGWIRAALNSYRVVLLDQRGTGRSTPVLRETVGHLGPAESLADYLGHFRADAIVADAEIVRQVVCGGERWSTLGQSYGGFITMSYLSNAPDALRECYVTGGLRGLTATPDDVYALSYPKVERRMHAYYARYPQDRPSSVPSRTSWPTATYASRTVIRSASVGCSSSASDWAWATPSSTCIGCSNPRWSARRWRPGSATR